MDDDTKAQRKSTWKPLYLATTALFVLMTLTYLCAVIYFVPLLDVTKKVFVTAETWKWIFPLLAFPLAFYIYYLIESLRNRETDKDSIATFVQWLGVGYALILVVIIGFNIAEWVNNCTSGAATTFAYCYDGTSLTVQYKFVFWSLIVHFVLFVVMLAMAWYTVKQDILEMHAPYTNAEAPAAYTRMHNVSSNSPRSGHFSS